nr:MAG TPA: tail protein [Caudoviricetes sp.]
MNTSLYGGLIEISPDGQPITPDLVLSYRGGTKQGIIHNVQSLTNANALVETAEISFDVYKEIDGVECQLWDDIRDFRLVYIPHLDTSTFNPWYELSVEVDENDCTIKHCQGVHLQEAELGQLTLNGVEINTEDDIARDDYSPTIIYDPKNPEASALDRILKDKASHYTIVHVDSSIANLQRTFSWDGSSIKDAFDDIANEVECLFKYGEYTNNDGKIHRTISVYDLNDRCMECGERGSFTTRVCPKCGSANINYGYGTDSGIFLSHENFAGDITYSSNKDSVKNCFRLVAGDDLMTATIRNINPSGSQYIWYLSDSVRADMSHALQDKLKAYDTKYESYSTEKQIDIPSTVISEYNALINKYKLYDDTLTNIKYPIIGYSALTDVYYSALNFYSLLKTTLAPASEHGEKTTAAKELTKLTTNTLSPLGIQNAEISSSATVTSAVQNYAKVFIDTSLYRITAKCNTYEAKVWKGTITLTGYSDDEDTATSAVLTVYVSDATPDFIKCQIEKAMKKNNVDATGTVALFKKSESEFKQALSFYSVDNLNILASIARGCLDILIQQGVADPANELYSSMYLPYYNRSVWIQDELREREAEVLKLRGTRSNPDGVLDYIEKQRQAIANKLDLRSYLGETLWVEFCSFRRDDTYQNDNFISDGLSDTELIAQAKEFIKNAEREIVKSATLQHTISCNLNNFLLVKEQDVEESPVPIVTLDGIHIITHDQLYLVKGNATFSPLLVNFEVGNWVHIEIDGVVYKLRLTSYKIDYDNLDKLDVEFSDVTYGLDYMSDTQSILAQAQSMATSYSMVQHQANKGNNANKQIMDMVENGLNLTNKRIVNAADNQNMVVDESGLLMREKNEFGDDYSAEQTKIINHGFYYTNDGWKTVKTGLGKYIYYDPETGTYKEDYGIIAHKIVGNIILGNELGIYNTSGSVKIDQNGMTITADASDTNKDLFTLQRKNEDGSYTKYVYVDDDGNIKINGRHIQMTTSDDLGSYIDKTIKQEAAALVVQLTNEYIGITTDSNGNGGNFTDCYTDVLVFSGSTDITKSSDLKWTITATSGVIGEWDKTNHRYTIKNLTTSVGEVVFDLIYMDKLSVSKKFRIAKLKAGADGGQGLPGRDGVDGKSSYVHIKYSPVANPTDGLMTEVPSTYIGICVDENVNDPTTASSYTWSKFTGKDGKDGTAGADSYVHFAYAQSADGSVNFSVVEYEGATHIGVYTDNVKEDSTDYKKYAWSQIRGEDGTSVYIVSTEVVYIPSDSGTTPPTANSMATNDGKIIVDHNGNELATNKWLTTVPNVIEGSYLWTRTTVNYSDGNSTVTYSVSRQGIDGADGIDGINGRDGRDGSSNYVHIKYSAYPNPADSQISEVPSDYIGICVNDVIKDPDTANSYTWSKFVGKDGEDGIPGKNGYVHFAYAMSADGKEGFSKSEFTGATYIGVYSDNVQADSGNYKDYAWSLIKGADGKTPVKGVDYFDGVSSYLWIRYATDANGSGMTTTPSSTTKYIGTTSTTTSTAPTAASAYKWSKYVGENGTPGENGYVHIAYADSADGKTGFNTTVGADKKYIGQYTDNIEADSTDPTKYTWSLIKGADVTITSTKIEYIATTEKSTTPPESIELITSGGLSLIDNSSRTFVTNKWSDEMPELSDGMILWTRTTVNYSDGNSTVTYTNAKQGDTGVTGRTYFLEVDTSAVKIDGNNIITPDTVKVRGYYRDGNGDREVYPCRFVITKTYSDNRTEEVFSSSGNVAEQSFTVYGEADMPTFYTVEMHKASQAPNDNNLLDIQTIPILVDSANMMIGARNLLKKSNQLEGCHYYGTSGAYSISEDEIDAKRVVKIQSATGSNAAKAIYYEVYTDNLIASAIGTKLTVSMNVYSRQNTTISVCLANTNGVMQTTDMQQIQLAPGWNKVYTVLTIQDTDFELVTDSRNNFATSSGRIITTGTVGIISNVLRINDNMNGNDYYAIDHIQLEKGNRPTDYYPAPEDLIDYTDKITGDMSDELKEIISEIINDVVANRKDFDDLVGEDGRIEEIRKSSVTTQQQVDKVQTDVNTYIVRVDAINGKIESIEQTTECFSMEDAGLRITRKISSQDPSKQLSMLLSEQKLSFYQGTDEVAYFSNNKLYVTDAEILERLQLGKFAFIPRSNGNLSFRYLGGN